MIFLVSKGNYFCYEFKSVYSIQFFFPIYFLYPYINFKSVMDILLKVFNNFFDASAHSSAVTK